MDPFTISVLASALIGTATQIAAGVVQNNAAKYEAEVAEMKAKEEEAVSRENLRRERRENEFFLARQIALRAKSGVSIESGSSLLVAAESAKRLEMNALSERRLSRGRQATLQSQASASRRAGKLAMTTSFFKAGESLIRSGTNAIPMI